VAGITSGPEQVSLDRHALDAIRGLQNDSAPDLLARVVHVYFESAPSLIERLRTGLAAHDTEAVRVAAHSLKSSSANLGATVLADMCKQLELAARAGAFASGLPDAQAIDREYTVVRGLLAAEIGEGSS